MRVSRTSQVQGDPPGILRLVASFVAAVFVGFATFFVMLSLTSPQADWRGEVIVAAFVAATWMATGVRLSRQHTITCALLLVSGAASAWFLARATVYGTSPYYGLLTYAVAVVAGGAVWVAMVRRSARRVAWALACSVCILVVPVASALTSAMPVTRLTMYTDRGREDVSVLSKLGPGATHLWQRPGSSLGVSDTTLSIRIDLTASGPSPYTLHRVVDQAEHQAVCAGLRRATVNRISTEIASRAIPRFMASVPRREYDCAAGRVWRFDLDRRDVSDETTATAEPHPDAS